MVGPQRTPPAPPVALGADAAGDGYVVLAEGPQDVEDGRNRNRIRSSSDVTKLQRHRNRNIRITMFFTATSTVVFSIIQWNIFDAYLSFLSKSLGMQLINSSVGFAESIVGLTSLIIAVPVGLMVDRYSRTKILKSTAIVGLIAAAISSYAFAYDSIIPLYINLFLWGIYSEFAGSAAEAIFADSIPTGKRSSYFAQKGILERLSLSVGPGIMIVLFFFLGDEWTLKQLHVPLLMGCFLAPIPCLLLWLYRNPHPEVAFPQTPASPVASTVPSQILAASPITVREQLTCASPTVHFPVEDETRDHNIAEQEQARLANLSWQESSIPYIVAVSDFVRKIGAGMTIKFFPLFFINDYGFRPINISMLFCAFPFCAGIATMVLQRVARPMGRAQAVLLFQFCGIAFLVGMCYLQNVWLMVIFFILRGSFQNAGYPIDRSIIMDYVPSNRRGMWNAIESITSMTWSGSAVLGGIITDFHDYRYTFLITATIYTIAGILYVPLVFLVPKSEKDLVKTRRQQAVRSKVVPGGPIGGAALDDQMATRDTTGSDDASAMVVVYASEGDASFLLDDREAPLLTKDAPQGGDGTGPHSGNAVVARR